MATSPNTRWMSPPPVYDTHSTPTQYTTLTPYLQLSHILSLTWLAYPIISLLFVAFRLQLSSAAAADAAANAKDDLLTSCKAAETAATSAASIPRYLAVASNAQIADAVNGTLNAARATLVLALTIMEVIINFIIDIYRSTFLCFLELVVRGGLSLIIGAVQEVYLHAFGVGEILKALIPVQLLHPEYFQWSSDLHSERCGGSQLGDQDRCRCRQQSQSVQ